MLDLLVRLLAWLAGQLPGKPSDESSCVLMPATQQGLHHIWEELDPLPVTDLDNLVFQQKYLAQFMRFHIYAVVRNEV